MDGKRLIFIDESGYRLGGTPRYGWSPIGQDAYGGHIQGNWTMMTMIGAMSLDGFRGFMNIDSGTSKEVFIAFIKEILSPNIKKGDIVVMDNLAAHKNIEVKEIIEKCGGKVVYIPPYSPEFNPIEKAWAKIKDILRRQDTENEEKFDNAVEFAIKSISTSDIAGWIKHSGYVINQ